MLIKPLMLFSSICLLNYSAFAMDFFKKNLGSKYKHTDEINKKKQTEICCICKTSPLQGWPHKITLCKKQNAKHSICVSCLPHIFRGIDFDKDDFEGIKCPICENSIFSWKKPGKILFVDATTELYKEQLTHKKVRQVLSDMANEMDKFTEKIVDSAEELDKELAKSKMYNLYLTAALVGVGGYAIYKFIRS